MAAQLTGAQREQLWHALLAAFPDHDALEEMVSFQLNQNLDAIAGGLNLSGIVLNLIQWAESEGRVADLVAGARAANPGNADLQAFATGWTAAPAPPRTPPTAATGSPAGGAPRLSTPLLAGGGVALLLLLGAAAILFRPGPSPGARATATPPPLLTTATPLPVPSATPLPPTVAATATPLPPTVTPTPAPPSATPGPPAADCTGAPACFNAGNQYLGAGDWHRAIVEYNRAIQADPAFADAYDSLGYALDRTGDYDRAIHEYEQAIALDSRNPLYYYNRGSTYYRIAQVRDLANPSLQAIDYQHVIADMSKALDLGLNQQVAYTYFFRGASYGATHDATHARSDLTKARELCTALNDNGSLCREVDAALQALGP